MGFESVIEHLLIEIPNNGIRKCNRALINLNTYWRKDSSIQEQHFSNETAKRILG